MKVIKILMKLGLTKEIATNIDLLANKPFIFELKNRIQTTINYYKNHPKFVLTPFYGRVFCRRCKKFIDSNHCKSKRKFPASITTEFYYVVPIKQYSQVGKFFHIVAPITWKLEYKVKYDKYDKNKISIENYNWLIRTTKFYCNKYQIKIKIKEDDDDNDGDENNTYSDDE